MAPRWRSSPLPRGARTNFVNESRVADNEVVVKFRNAPTANLATVGARLQLLLERSGVMRKDLRRSASEHDAKATGSSTRRPSRILFLGGSYSPLSVACLQTLVDLQHHIVVGRYDPWTKGVWGLIRERSRSRGWCLVLHKTAYLMRSKGRVVLRKMGLPLSGFASLPELCYARGLSMIRCSNPHASEFIQQVQQLGVDLIVVALFPRILKRALIDIPRLGCINVHPSLLPRYRGPEPFYWVLANRETTSGPCNPAKIPWRVFFVKLRVQTLGLRG